MTSITVVGAGNMGAGIAQKYATEGYKVLLVDLNEEALAKGKSRIEATLSEAVAKGILSETKRTEIFEQLAFSTDLQNARDSSVVIEAIFEDKAAKKQLFSALDALCAPHTILATNTSSFYVSELAKATKRPDRCVGLHYFYHPAKNKLVEVIKGHATSQAIFDTVWMIQEKIGKIPVASEDKPGFIVNRFFVPWLNEAMRLVETGISNIATVDAAAQETFGIGMGPFALMNATGVPITFHTATTLAEELGSFYAPSPLIKPLVQKKSQWDTSGVVHSEHFRVISERLMGIVFYVAHQLVFTDKVCSLEDCDLAARVGLRWPMGPFQLINQVGLMPALTATQKALAPYPELHVPAPLVEHCQLEQPYAIQWVTWRVENKVGIITFNRPDAMNALNADVIQQLKATFSMLASQPSVQGIVLEGRGKTFVAGADTRFFVENIRGNTLARINAFTLEAQTLFREIDNCQKPVVCKLNGLALGGGLELALACDYIVASQHAWMGFPETGIGIYPGLGGTQRTPRRVGIEIARWLILSGEMISAGTAVGIGLIDECVNPTQLHQVALDRALSRTFPHPQTSSSKPDLQDLAATFQLPLPELLSPHYNPTSTKAQRAIAQLRSKAPIALQHADELISHAQEHDLETGLQAEFAYIPTIFATHDALLGLSSIGGKKPVFTGT